MSNSDDVKPTGFISSEKTDEEKMQDFFISVPLRGAQFIRKYLNISENEYRYTVGYASGNPRDYYLYGILDELEKAGVSLLQVSRFIVESKKEDELNIHGSDDERLKRNIYSSIIDELSVWNRKLTEILIEVIGFKSTNENNYYLHYLLVINVINNKKTLSDFRTYYHCENENIKYQIKENETQITKVLQLVDPKKCWYVKLKNGKPTNKASSFKDRQFNLYHLFTSSQKLAIGVSYKSYSTLSSNMHISIGQRDYDVSMSDVETYFSHISILSANILIVVKDILKKKPKGFIRQLNRIIMYKSNSSDILKRKNKTQIIKGDFVLAYNDLAEVIKINKSKFGYVSIRVRYLDKSPLPQIKEEEFPAVYVKLLYKRLFITREVRRNIKLKSPNIKISNKYIVNLVRKSVVHMWNELGLKERVNRQPELARQKVQDYLSRMKLEKDYENHR